MLQHAATLVRIYSNLSKNPKVLAYPEFPQGPIYTWSLLVMRGKSNTPLPTHPLFFCGKLCENAVFGPFLLVDSRALRLREMRALASSHIQYAGPINAKF